jgi:hypothetical protein
MYVMELSTQHTKHHHHHHHNNNNNNNLLVLVKLKESEIFCSYQFLT